MKTISSGNKVPSGRLILGLFACALALLALTGCQSFRMWGEKSSSTPGSVGGSMSIPLGRK